mgnify:CR=1 FL=1
MVDLQRQPIAGATVDVWQASPVGLYENQDDAQPDKNLRGRFTTDHEGRFALRTVRPAGYPIPIVGPVGQLLAHQHREAMRPAHIHFIAIAEGYRVLATQIFDATDRHIANDVVRDYAAIRGRVGYLFSPETMLYATAGWTGQDVDASAPTDGNVNETIDGFTYGLGIEHRMNERSEEHTSELQSH